MAQRRLGHRHAGAGLHEREVAAGALRFAQGSRRSMEERGRSVLFADFDNAARNADLQVLACQQELVSLNRLTHSLQGRGGAVWLGVAEEDRHDLAGQTRDDIEAPVAPHGFADQPVDLSDHTIAHQRAVLFVDPAQAVDIHQREAGRLAARSVSDDH